MVTTKAFLAQVLQVEAEKPVYRLGGSATDGTCDCVGLIIGALRRAGGQWTGIHGSNWAARNEVTNLRAVSRAAHLQAGDLVFKAREKGQRGYALPARYAGDPDTRDYYHMGVVVSVSPLVIIHCTTPTVKRDTKLGKWRYAASLKALSTSDEAAGTVIVRATLRQGDRGDQVRLMQELLRQNGIQLPRYGTDGVFGAETKQAVMRFQAARGLAVDGICGARTWAALQEVEA